MIIISTTVCEELGEFKIARTPTGIWVRHSRGRFHASQDDWRAIIKQVSALLEEPEKIEVAPEMEAAPDPRGYVFVDRDGDRWGWDDDITERSPGKTAQRPFRTRAEAQSAGAGCSFRCDRIEVWTPECGVPPMPEEVS